MTDYFRFVPSAADRTSESQKSYEAVKSLLAQSIIQATS
jgi:hypothetical protein